MTHLQSRMDPFRIALPVRDAAAFWSASGFSTSKKGFSFSLYLKFCFSKWMWIALLAWLNCSVRRPWKDFNRVAIEIELGTEGKVEWSFQIAWTTKKGILKVDLILLQRLFSVIDSFVWLSFFWNELSARKCSDGLFVRWMEAICLNFIFVW